MGFFLLLFLVFFFVCLVFWGFFFIFFFFCCCFVQCFTSVYTRLVQNGTLRSSDNSSIRFDS